MKKIWTMTWIELLKKQTLTTRMMQVIMKTTLRRSSRSIRTNMMAVRLKTLCNVSRHKVRPVRNKALKIKLGKSRKTNNK